MNDTNKNMLIVDMFMEAQDKKLRLINKRDTLELDPEATVEEFDLYTLEIAKYETLTRLYTFLYNSIHAVGDQPPF